MVNGVLTRRSEKDMGYLFERTGLFMKASFITTKCTGSDDSSLSLAIFIRETSETGSSMGSATICTTQTCRFTKEILKTIYKTDKAKRFGQTEQCTREAFTKGKSMGLASSNGAMDRFSKEISPITTSMAKENIPGLTRGITMESGKTT